MRVHFAVLRIALLLGCLVAQRQLCAAAPVAGNAQNPIRIGFTLPKASYVTLVIDDAEGVRVRNLVAETRFPAGKNVVFWDGYNEGVKNAGGDVVRRLALPGRYTVRGLVHDGIHLSYEFSVYSPGNPPWFIPDGSGAWLGDHTPAASVLYLPQGVSPYGNGEPQMTVGSQVGEAGNPQVWMDLTGRKLNGGMKMFGWYGARALTRDRGPNPNSEYYAYGAWLTNEDNKPLLNLFGLTKPKEPSQDGVFVMGVPTKPSLRDAEHSTLSIASWNGVVVAGDSPSARLDFVDIRSKTILGSVPMIRPRGVFFDAAGRLFVITNDTVVRFDHVDVAHASLGAGKVIIGAGLDQPRQVFVADDGRIFVSNWGAINQIKVFSAEGKPAMVIGKAGGRQIGAYDELRMTSPNGMAIDGNGVLWVTEDDSLPRRISLWSSIDGHFVKAIYGSVGYGGGGEIDAHDPTRFYYSADFQGGGAQGGLEFKLDWAAGTSKLVNVYMRQIEPGIDEEHPAAENQLADSLPDCIVPETPVTIGKFRYLINTYNSWQRPAGSAGIWKLDAQGVAWPVAFVGGGTGWFQRFFDHQPSQMAMSLQNAPGLKVLIERQLAAQHGDWPDAFITWSDTNGNHRMDPDEVHVRVFPYQTTAYDPSLPKQFQNYANFFGAHSLSTKDLAFTGGWSVQLPAPTFDADGIPAYDISQAHLAMRPEAVWRSLPDGDDGDRFDVAGNDWLVIEPTRGYKNHKLMWTYPVHDALFPPRAPGEIIAVGRPLGPMVTPGGGSDAGPVFTVNSDKGAFYMMTADGLYVQTLGGDMRTHPLIRDPKLFRRGANFDGYSFEDELFHPSMTQTDKGDVYIVAGKEHSSIFHVTGLNTIQRRTFGTLELSRATLASRTDQKIEPARRQQSGSLVVAVMKAPPGPINNIQSWKDIGIDQARIDDRTLGSVAIAGDRLIGIWQTGDPNLLHAAGGDWRYQFKHGGALDLMLATAKGPGLRYMNGVPNGVADRREPAAGDERLLVTTVNGAVRAVLFRPVAPDAPAGRSVSYTSPVGHLVFDDVQDVSSQVTLSQSGGDYYVSVPLSVLGLHPVAGDSIHGDIGIIRGDGSQAIQRVYWNNLDTTVVSDIPSEARLQPSQWGVWDFQTAPTIVDGTTTPALKPDGLVPGLRYQHYLGNWNAVPNFTALKPAGSGFTDRFRADLGPTSSNYGLVLEGCLKFPADGVYIFRLSSDDGSRLYIDGRLVVSDDGQHGMDNAFGGIRIKAGEHSIRVSYYQAGGGRGLTVSWTGPDMTTREIAPEDLSYAPNLH